MASRIIRSDEQTFRARMDRRLTTGTVVGVDKTSGQAVLDMGVTHPDGTPVYYAGVPFSPQQPPQPGDSVSLTYSNVSPHSVTISSMQVGTQQAANPNNAQVVSNGGVMSVEASGQPRLTGNVQLVSGTNVTLSQAGQAITVSSSGGAGTPATTVQPVEALGVVGTGANYAREDHGHAGVHSLSQSGSAALTGDVTLSAGANVTLTQSGNNIAIVASGSGGISGIGVDLGGTPIGTRLGINLIAGSNVTLSAVDDPGANRVDVTVNSTVGSSDPAIWYLNYYSAVATITPGVSICLTGGGAFTLTLPPADSAHNGALYLLFNAPGGGVSNTLTVHDASGALLGTLTGNQSAEFVSVYIPGLATILRVF